MESLGTFLPLILIGVIAYLLIFRPARTRQKQQQQLLAALTPGSQVMTTAGVFGTVITVDDDEITLEVAPGVVLRMVKAAVARVIEPDLPDAGLDSASDEGFGTPGTLSKDA